jgi:hypothetical protein
MMGGLLAATCEHNQPSIGTSPASGLDPMKPAASRANNSSNPATHAARSSSIDIIIGDGPNG